MPVINSEEAYEQCIAAIMAIAQEKVRHANMPTEVATAEARELGEAARQDREAILSLNVAAELVDSLPVRAAAFTHAVGLYEACIAGDPEAAARLKELLPKGYALQKYLDKYMSYAYRNDIPYSKKMDEVRKGHGHRDMTMDLKTYNIIARDNPEPLRRMPAFDFNKVAEALATHDAIMDAQAKAGVDPQQAEETKDIMNRAYTYYKMAADEIITAGRFLFEGTERYNNYISEYRQKLSKKAARTAQTANPDTAEAV
ncbi:MAG: hypothetical protein JXR76_10175 [Deltaproteobacteria bacterium]|nr:hypothetical protein [Deltaproteobacteria bacterium]